MTVSLMSYCTAHPPIDYPAKELEGQVVKCRHIHRTKIVIPKFNGFICLRF